MESNMNKCPECGEYTAKEVGSYNAENIDADKEGTIILYRCENCGYEFNDYYE